MKIRIKGNSVRFRLSKTEIEKFKQTGLLTEQTEFGDSIFSYAIKADAACEELKASFANNTLTVIVPAPIHQEWTNSDVVGFENKWAFSQGKELFILIEKDFVCLDNTFEDQSDNYPNPNAFC